jgi:hypothetical protein
MLRAIYRLAAVAGVGLLVLFGLLYWTARSNSAIPQDALAISLDPSELSLEPGQAARLRVTVQNRLDQGVVRRARLVLGPELFKACEAEAATEGWRRDKDPWLRVIRFDAELGLGPGESLTLELTLKPLRPGEYEDDVAIHGQIPILPFGVARRQAAARLTVQVRGD